METGDVIALVGEGIAVLTILAGGVWATARMQASISALTKEISRMTAAISKQEDRLDGHHDRLLRLEVRDGMDETTKIRRMDR